MELYGDVSMAISRLLTRRYSTSFASASRLFAPQIERNIYAIYGLVRIADEIVDTYTGIDRNLLLDNLEAETYAAVKRQFSANPIVHAFALTAREFGIGRELIKPFFASMRMDLQPRTYTRQKYDEYIYGSAEVVGLMCLRIFTDNNQEEYDNLSAGARRLGAAYQKVNFLRDLAEDHAARGRWYFPDIDYEHFDDTAKRKVVAEIKADFEAVYPYIDALPTAAHRAVSLSYRYYNELLAILDSAPAATVKQSRLRVPNSRKVRLLAGAKLKVRK